MNLPTLKNLNLKDKKVFIRLDLDVNLDDGKVLNDNRLEYAISTIQHCLEVADKVILAGHRGRPEDKFEEELSTKPLLNYFNNKLKTDTQLIPFQPFLENFQQNYDFVNNSENKLFLLENLRFWPGEKQNSDNFINALSGFADVYINESFATAHRKHSSVYGLPQLLKSQDKQIAFGFRFADEVKHLSEVLSSDKYPKLININGKKKDKIDHLEGLKNNFDKVLMGGRLPDHLPEDFKDSKVLVGKLVMDKSDITINSMEAFSKEIKASKIIVISGPMSKYEEEGHEQGTVAIFKAVKENIDAFKVAGGGDTEAALEKFGFLDVFDWVSTGGGAMLEYLSTGTLPTLEVIS